MPASSNQVEKVCRRSWGPRSLRSARLPSRGGSQADRCRAPVPAAQRGDPYLARAEVWQIVEQLGMLDERVHRLDGDRPGAARGADRAELEAAAAALIGYSLAGRRSDDQLLLGSRRPGPSARSSGAAMGT
jgi:hypothetical protein